jgi:hypothetical protein
VEGLGATTVATLDPKSCRRGGDPLPGPQKAPNQRIGKVPLEELNGVLGRQQGALAAGGNS